MRLPRDRGRGVHVLRGEYPELANRPRHDYCTSLSWSEWRPFRTAARPGSRTAIVWRLVMKGNDAMKQDRRRFLRVAGAASAAFALGGLPFAARAASAASDRLKIGVV